MENLCFISSGLRKKREICQVKWNKREKSAHRKKKSLHKHARGEESIVLHPESWKVTKVSRKAKIGWMQARGGGKKENFSSASNFSEEEEE